MHGARSTDTWSGRDRRAAEMGQFETLRQRKRARERLGPQFSLKSSHHILLPGGGMSLSIMEEVMPKQR